MALLPTRISNVRLFADHVDRRCVRSNTPATPNTNVAQCLPDGIRAALIGDSWATCICRNQYSPAIYLQHLINARCTVHLAKERHPILREGAQSPSLVWSRHQPVSYLPPLSHARSTPIYKAEGVPTVGLPTWASPHHCPYSCRSSQQPDRAFPEHSAVPSEKSQSSETSFPSPTLPAENSDHHISITYPPG